MNYTEIADTFEKSLSEIPKNWQSTFNFMRGLEIPKDRMKSLDEWVWGLVESTLNFHYELISDTDQFEYGCTLLEKGN